ncbi:MAG TPA: DUF4097 family beta strand repeat-containing protein [Candidatus Deferrimicrobium sp.]|nr:DUF4097 family beta strand repeat-containing protein [Candidatus Deferrimicrobium sp.]
MAVITGLYIALSALVTAQSTLPPIEAIDREISPEGKSPHREEWQAAQDYVRLLKRLHTLADDYSAYFTAMRFQKAEKYAEQLGRVAAEIQSGAYLQQSDRLTSDIEDLKRRLHDDQRELRGSSARAYRLALSLGEELDALRLALQEVCSERPERSPEIQKQIRVYLKTLTPPRITDGFAGEHAIIVVVDSGDLDDLPDISTLGIPEDMLDSVIFVPGPVSVATTPALPPVTGPGIKNRFEDVVSDVIRKLADSTVVPSTALRIYVSSQLGDLQISGWEEQYVTARSTVEVSAGSGRGAEALADQIALDVSREGDSVSAILILPELTDPQSRIVNCRLTVNVPRRNPLVVSTAYGETEIEGLRNSVKLSATSSEALLKDIRGAVDITASMGPIDMSEIQGRISVKASHSPVQLARCQGDIDITNAFSSVSLSQCVGQATIQNSGPTEIMRHSGSVQIENQNGSIAVARLSGDLKVRSSFESLSIDDVAGSVDIKNTNGNVEVQNVTGKFLAENSFGSIYGSRLQGPIRLTTHNGTIEVVLAESFAGSSTIDASFGTIRVSIPSEANMLITATAVGGQIESYFPITVARAGLTQSAELIIGRGKTPLVISGNHANIVISQSE